MDILKDKTYRQYSSLSRYTGFPFYFNTLDSKYIYSLTSNLKNETTYVNHKVKLTDTLNSLALYYYGRPDFYWVIADFNRIADPFITLFDKFTDIKIPSLSNLQFEEQ